MKRIFTSTYWIFWLGILPVVYWSGSIDFEFPKFLVMISGINIWGVVYILTFKNTFFEINNKIDRYVVATALISLISWIINGCRANGLVGDFYRYSGLITLGSLVELYFLSKYLLPSDRDFIYIVRWVAILLCAMSLFWPLMGNANFIAAYIALLSSGSILSFEKLGSGVICWITGSRSAALGWMISILLNMKSKFIYLGILMAIVLIIIFPKKTISHFDNRIVIWQKSIEIIVKKPIIGWGPEGYETGFKTVVKDNEFDLKNIRVDRSHNIFMDIAVNTGIIGLLIWLGLFYQILKHGRISDKIFLITFVVISSLNVINLNAWILFYMMTARLSNIEAYKLS